jgi:thymidylate synthase (FAD)
MKNRIPNIILFNKKPRTIFNKDFENIKVKLINVNVSQKEMENLIKKLVMASWVPESKEKISLKKILRGGTLQNAFESIVFTFLVSGVSRICTHQIVRGRVGMGYCQETSENDWRNHDIKIFTSIIKKGFEKEYKELCLKSKDLYARMVDSGVPVDVARAILPNATETFIYVIINMRALKNFVSTRLCENQWFETAYVAYLMKKEVEKRFPILKNYFKPLCDELGRCLYGSKGILSGTLYLPCGRNPISKGHKHKYVYSSTASKMRGISVMRLMKK